MNFFASPFFRQGIRPVRLILGLWLVLVAVGALRAEPTVANVTIAQRAGTKLVDIGYDLAGDVGVTCTVSFAATRDGGATYESISALTGAVGAGLTPGVGKTAVWDAGSEWPGLKFPGVRVRATATADGAGTLSGVVKDGLTGAALAGVGIQFFSGSNAVASVVTGAEGNYSLTLPAGRLRAQLTLAGYAATSLNVTVVAGQAVEADVVLFAQLRAGNGTIRGRVVNAFNASGVAGAAVNMRAGVSTTTGAVVQTTFSDGSGQFELLAPSGSYTLQASASGFGTGFANVVAVGGQVIANQNVELTPNLQVNEVRFVLAWGAVPTDLDSHLAGPGGAGGTFHAYYNAKSPAGSSVALDVDDTSSYGPETFTVSAFRPGTYRYWVHDYTNRGIPGSTVMSQRSAARVTIYRGTGAGTVAVATYNVPTGRAGNAWVVFDIDGATGAITPINAVGSIAGDTTIP